MTRFAAYMLCGSVALAACAAPPTSPTAAASKTPVDPAVAGQIFAAACLQNLPRFSGTPAALAALPITRNSANGVYYHNNLNLLVRLLDSSEGPACQLTYGTDVQRDQATVTFFRNASAAAPGVQADIVQDVARGPDDLLYFTTTTRAQ